MLNALNKTRADIDEKVTKTRANFDQAVNKTKADLEEKTSSVAASAKGTLGTVDQLPWAPPDASFAALGEDGVCITSESPVTLFSISPEGKRTKLSSEFPFIICLDSSCGYRPVCIIGQLFTFLPSQIFKPHPTLLLFPSQTESTLGLTYGVLFEGSGVDSKLDALLSSLASVSSELLLAAPSGSSSGEAVASAIADIPDPISSPAPAPDRAASKGDEWASWIAKKGETTSRSILESSAAVGRIVKEKAEAVTKHYEQEDPFDKARRFHPKISASTQNNLKTVEDISQTVLKGSRLVLSASVLGFKKAGTVISQTAYKVADHVQPKKDDEDVDPNAPPSTLSEVGVVASASLSAGLDVYHSLRRAAWSVLSDTSDASVVAVRARYGDDMGQAAATISGATLNLGAAAVVASSLAGGALDVAIEVGVESADSFVSAGDFVQGECRCWGVVDLRTAVWTWRRGFAVVRECAVMIWAFEVAKEGFQKYESVISLEDFRSVKLEEAEGGKTTIVISTRDGVIRDLRFATKEKCKLWLEKLTIAMEGVTRNKLLALRPLDDKVSW